MRLNKWDDIMKAKVRPWESQADHVADHVAEPDPAPLPAPPLPPLPHQPLAALLWKHSEALEALETGIRGSRRLEGLCRDFELQKVCYLPLNTFLLRPLHRLMHYKQVLERLCKHYPPSHADFRDCRGEWGCVSGRRTVSQAGQTRSAGPGPIFPVPSWTVLSRRQ